jgi:hypothetical protein
MLVNFNIVREISTYRLRKHILYKDIFEVHENRTFYSCDNSLQHKSPLQACPEIM